jgi:hypothetical protein
MLGETAVSFFSNDTLSYCDLDKGAAGAAWINTSTIFVLGMLPGLAFFTGFI